MGYVCHCFKVFISSSLLLKWSFGVTMWEVFTSGRVPFAGIHLLNLLNQLLSGKRLEKPNNEACNDDLLVSHFWLILYNRLFIVCFLFRYEMMLSCWSLDSCERPTFMCLAASLDAVLEKESGYLQLSQPLSPRGKINNSFQLETLQFPIEHDS